MKMRYDPEREVYRDCKWCSGNGCIYCKSEADKAYKSAFPDGPQPIATFTNEELLTARDAIGAEAITKAFSEGGGGMDELLENLRKIGK